MIRSIVLVVLLSSCGSEIKEEYIRYAGEREEPIEERCSVSCYSWFDTDLSDYCRNKLKDCAIID